MNKKIITLAVLILSANSYGSDNEAEPNNSANEANQISHEVTLHGHIDLSDVDWYFFDIVGSDVLKLYTAGETLEIAIYNENEAKFRGNTVTPGGTVNAVLPSAGRYFISIKNSQSLAKKYSLTLNLANVGQNNISTSSCSNAKYDGSTGTLEIPAVDVTHLFGGITTYSVTMQLKPLSDKLLFEVSQATPK